MQSQKKSIPVQEIDSWANWEWSIAPQQQLLGLLPTLISAQKPNTEDKDIAAV